jgi:hypothetical protein
LRPITPSPVHDIWASQTTPIAAQYEESMAGSDHAPERETVAFDLAV